MPKKKEVKEVEKLTHKHVIVNKMLSVDLTKLKRTEVIRTFEVALARLLVTKEYDVIIAIVNRMKEYDKKKVK